MTDLSPEIAVQARVAGYGLAKEVMDLVPSDSLFKTDPTRCLEKLKAERGAQQNQGNFLA